MTQTTTKKRKTKSVQSDRIITPEFRVSFPFVFEKGEDQSGKQYWGVTMIFPPNADFTGMKKAVNQVLKQKFPTGEYPPKLHKPFRKGTPDEYDLEKRPEYKGNIICAAKSFNAPPQVIGVDKQEIIDPSEFYAGCYARATLNAYWFDVGTNRGVTWALQNLLKTREGEPLVSRTTAEDDFQAFFQDDNEDEGVEDDNLFDL